MLKIHPIPAFTDNYIWAMINDEIQEVIIVDAGDAEPVIEFVNRENLTITQIWVTHHHSDHIGGVTALANAFPNAQIFAHANIHPLINATQLIPVAEGRELTAWGSPVQVWQVAGHTENHLAYLVTLDNRLHIFCGDTLFRAGCGRVFTGTIETLFESFDRFAQLHDDEALFYPAHEYTLSNLKFAQFIEPNNPAIQKAIEHDNQLRSQNKPTLPTSLADEKAINPFIRAVIAPSDEMINTVQTQTGIEDDSPFEIFKALRQLKNNF
nr:hydroxyacylglutathione hydrolase [Moraxella sp. CTOTU47915]